MDGKWGFINEKNELIIPYMYDEVSWFGMGKDEPIDEDQVFVKRNGEWGLINAKNEIIIPFHYNADYDWDVALDEDNW